MTPKLYEQVTTKLVATWGDYAGWAQSVRAINIFAVNLRSTDADHFPDIVYLRLKGVLNDYSGSLTEPDSVT